MFDALITSKMRVRILMRLFLNPENQAYLRELAGEFQASPGHLRSELLQLNKAGLLTSAQDGRQVQYKANHRHPLFPELQSMVRKALGMDHIIESIIERLGNLEAAYLTGDFAAGFDSGIIDLLLVGDINRENLADLTAKTQRHLQRRIRTRVVGSQEIVRLQANLQRRGLLLLWRQTTEILNNESKGA